MFLSPQNSDVEILTPRMLVSEGGIFGRVVYDSAALIHGTSALIKETPEGCLASSTMGGHSEKGPPMNQKAPLPRYQICQCLDFGFSSLQNYEK